MRQVIGGFAAFTFAAAFVQAPWAHVHADTEDPHHYQEQHRGLGAVHGHDLDSAAHGPEWGAKGSDHDARSPRGVRLEYEAHGIGKKEFKRKRYLD